MEDGDEEDDDAVLQSNPQAKKQRPVSGRISPSVGTKPIRPLSPRPTSNPTSRPPTASRRSGYSRGLGTSSTPNTAKAYNSRLEETKPQEIQKERDDEEEKLQDSSQKIKIMQEICSRYFDDNVRISSF